MGERDPPSLFLIYEVFSEDEKIIGLLELLKEKVKDFDELSAYGKWAVLRSIKTDEIDEKDKRLLRAITFTPHLYWMGKVPLEAREYISALFSQGRFGTDIVGAISRIDIDYTGPMEEETSITMDPKGREKYDVPKYKDEIFEILSRRYKSQERNFTARSRKSLLLAIYHKGEKDKLIREHVWEKKEQIYSVEWKDASRKVHKEKWLLAKCGLRDKPISFIKEIHEEKTSSLGQGALLFSMALLLGLATMFTFPTKANTPLYTPPAVENAITEAEGLSEIEEVKTLKEEKLRSFKNLLSSVKKTIRASI